MDLNCPNCAQPVHADDSFCGACGTKLPGRAPAATSVPGEVRAPPPSTGSRAVGSPTTEVVGAPRTARSWLPSAIALLALVGALIGWMMIQGTKDSGTAHGNEVYLEPEGVVIEAFTPPAVTTASKDQEGAPTTLTVTSDATVAVVKGSIELTYAASREVPVCDSEALIAYLYHDQTLATAWADALGIPVTQVEGFIRSLTPVLLQHDARLTTYTLADGHPVPRQSLLQRGSAVLVAATGEPRVRCASGSPLTAPMPVATPTYVGIAWLGFDPDNVVEIAPCDEPLTEFVVQDSTTGEAFVVPVGSGATDVVAAAGETVTSISVTTKGAPATATTVATTTTAPTTTTLPVADYDATDEGTVTASSQLCGSYAPTKATDGDVTTSWISSSGDGSVSNFQWTGPADEFIGSVTMISNAANAKRSTNHGFAAVTIQVFDSSGGLVFETRVDLPGTPDPDVVVYPNVVGRQVMLLLEGHENPSGSGFAEFIVMVARGTG